MFKSRQGQICLHVYSAVRILETNWFQKLADRIFKCTGPLGAMVACLTPDQNVVCSNHVDVKFFSTLTLLFELFEQASSKN